MNTTPVYFTGIDIGSTASKTVVLKEGKIEDYFVLPTGWNGRETANAILEQLKSRGYADDMRCVATGYGRICVDYADKIVTEITCHGKGGWAIFKKNMTIIDVGGQDTKMIKVVDGQVADFLMNDKCAAGTGKFIEVMATRLGADLNEMYELAAKGQPLAISAMCTVFAESEVISHIGSGEKREDIAAERRESVHGVFVLGVRNDVSVFRHERGKLPERRFHILEILEEVEMVRLDVQDDRHRGRKRVEGIVIFARLHHDRVARADTVAGMQQRQRSADHNGRVALSGHEDVRAHGGRRRLAVRAGDAERVAVILHDRAPRLRALKHRKPAAVRLNDLRVFVVHGGGADDKFGVRRDVLRAMPDEHGNAERAQMRHVRPLVHVRTGDRDAHAAQHQSERPHGDASDADQVNVLTGDKVAVQTFEIVCHIPSSCFRRSVRARRAGSELVRQRRVMTPLAFAELCGAAIRSVVRLKLSYCERAMQMNARDIRERRAILQKT